MIEVWPELQGLLTALKTRVEKLPDGGGPINSNFFLKLVQCQPQLNCEIQPIVVEGVCFNHT